MSLKNLSHFTAFNAPLFLSRKELRFISAASWVERTESDSKVEKGVKVGLLIFVDDSDYLNEKDNLGEQLVVKVPFASLDDFADYQPMMTVCEIVDIEKAIVYGEYRNQLSITAKVVKADDIVEL